MGFFKSSELEERLRKCENRLQEVQLEWENAYEKLLRLMGRIRKRAEADAGAEPVEKTPEDRGDGASVAGSYPGLTARQLAIQAQIVKRRGG